MKKFMLFVLTLAMVLSGMVGATAETTEELPVLTVALSPDFAPMEFIDTSKTGQEQYVGFDIFLAQYIAAELGMQLEIKPMSFDACQTAVQTGAVDMSISGFSRTPERAENFNLSDYYFAGDNETEQVIIVLAENAGTFAVAEDFDGMTVGAQDASLQQSLCNEQLPMSCTIKPFRSIDDAILSLMSGMVDAVAVAAGNADAIIANNPSIGLSGFEFEVDDEAKNNVILLQKGNDELLAQVNACLAKALAEGMYPIWYAAAEELAGIETAADVSYDEEGNVLVPEEEVVEEEADAE